MVKLRGYDKQRVASVLISVLLWPLKGRPKHAILGNKATVAFRFIQFIFPKFPKGINWPVNAVGRKNY